MGFKTRLSPQRRLGRSTTPLMCSICGRRFATAWFGGRGVGNGLIRQPDDHGFLLDPHIRIWSISYRFLSYLAGSKSVSVHMMTNTALKKLSYRFVERQK